MLQVGCFNFNCLCVSAGETIRIVIEEYVQHLSGYLLQLKFDPTLLFHSHFQYGNRISLEFSQLYHWHPMMPDSFHINGEELSYTQFLFNTSVLTRHGVEKLVDAFSRQVAGQVMNRTIMRSQLTKSHSVIIQIYFFFDFLYLVFLFCCNNTF